MKTSRIRNNILKTLIIIISITLLGFQSPSAKVNSELVQWEGPYSWGWVELIIFGEVSTSEGSFTWHQVQVTLPIVGTELGPQNRSPFQGQAFTFAQGTASRGPISVHGGWPVLWNIKGTIANPPDCTIELTIDETWYPGYTIGCAPFIGCETDVWPPGYYPGVPFQIPWEKGWGSTVSGGTAMGMPVHLTAIVYHVVTGGGASHPSGIDPLGCEYHMKYPVIPQAEE